MEQTRLRVLGDGLSLARGAKAMLLGKVPMHGLGLSDEEQIEKPFPQFLTNPQSDLFHLGEECPQWRPIGSIEAIGKIFCVSLDQGPAGVDFWRSRRL
jgi:hypothetical protein